MKRNFLFALLLLGMTHALSVVAAPMRYTAEPIEGWVVDKENGQPLEGVIVVAHWQLEGGFEGGYPMGQMRVLETLTDAQGRYYFAGWGPVAPVERQAETGARRY